MRHPGTRVQSAGLFAGSNYRGPTVKGMLQRRTWCSILLALSLIMPVAFAQGEESPVQFPVVPELFADEPLNACEGIAFNGEGRLFMTCNRAFWELSTAGVATKLADLDSNLGVAAIGERDLLVADFGPTNAFSNGRNTDGIVYRISPEGAKTVAASGIGDPNFILVLSDGSYLVSDDATADVYRVDTNGTVELYSTAVNHPNGLALSPDGSTLYVAQIFTNIRPVVLDGSIWAMRLVDGRPLRDARKIADAGPNAGVDGLAMDIEGRLYITANAAGQLWRYDPADESMTLIASGMVGIASLAFGDGAFDHQSIYATTTFSGGRGGKIWRIAVGTTGAPLYR